MGTLFGKATSIAVSISITFNVLYDDSYRCNRRFQFYLTYYKFFSQAMALGTLHALDPFLQH